ncbi:DUF5681 domain-containing protein, partial [Erythrobacter sp.]|uniref:DUF5681 domain-containing protein n=1 Tax=Erythrobacter sp. TaxID=1042 RepID=UPI002E9E58E4|nr:DUF5681 domain-containing protein [Erythrobacter sp.]
MPDRDDDEYVGFGRPPKSGQIRPGERRNPNGRPPKKRPDPETSPESELDRIIESVLGKTIAISENGVRRDVKVIEAIMQRQAADALKGSQVAQRDAIRLHRESEARAAKRVKAAEEAERRRAEERAAEEASWRRYLRELKHTQQKKWTDALAAGRDEPEDPWPHPDDIILGRSGSTYRIRG